MKPSTQQQSTSCFILVNSTINLPHTETQALTISYSTPAVLRHPYYRTFTNPHVYSYNLFHCSVLLGITDAVVETVFRTPEGLVTSWMNWYSDEPNDASKTLQEDCVARHTGGLWRDWRCSYQWNFYCEGKCFKEFSNTLFKYTSYSIHKIN